MKIVKPYATLLNYNMQYFTKEDGVAALRKIEWCARISHRSEDAQTADSWERFIRAVVLQHGDWSVVEHASATVDMLVDRGITHEIVRHRLFSFTQESTRFVNYEKKMPASFIDPLTSIAGSGYPDSSSVIWDKTINVIEGAYRELIGLGLAPQIARSVFPNALGSRIVVTGNLRSWRHFLLMRTTREAHPQMREVAIPLLNQFKAAVPILFEDIEPMARQVENIAKGR